MALLTGSQAQLDTPKGALGDALAGLKDAAPAVIERTLLWSAQNSGSREIANLKLMRAALADAFSALPDEVETLSLAPAERVQSDGRVVQDPHGDALRIQVRRDAPIQIALTGHYDTVFPAAHPFQTPVRRDASTLHGPGVADMKGGLSLMLAALQAFEALPGDKQVGYTVLLSPDEEIGSLGSAPLLAELGARAHVGMTYEPALPDGGLVSARTGSGNFALAIHGRAAHVGRAFADGRSAVETGAHFALGLLALNGKYPDVTFNVGAIDGGGPVNMVPDRAVVRFNIRAPDPEARAFAEREIGRLVREANAKDGLTASLHGAFTRPPKPLSPQLQKLVAWTRAAGRVLGRDLQFAPTGGVCEGNNLAAAGCWNIDTLGPCGGELHSDQEFALIDSFAERAQLSLLLLAGFESGVFDARSLRA